MRTQVTMGIIVWQLMLVKLFGFFVQDVSHIAQTVRNEANNVARHQEIIKQWADNYKLFTKQLEEARHLKEIIGNPQAALKRVTTDLWKGNSMDYFSNQEWFYWQLKETASHSRSLINRDKNLFKAIHSRDEAGNTIERDMDYYKRHDVIEQQASNIEALASKTHERKNALRTQRSETLMALTNASTESEVQVVTAQLAAIDGERTDIESIEANEFRKLELQKILNDERKEKERKDALERYVHEECLANNCIAEKLEKIKFRKEI